MSTRSNIVLFDSSINKTTDIYCHFDGYHEGVGATLSEHYNDLDKVKALIELGNISSLYANVAPEDGVEHSFSKKAEGVTVAYGRDRNEEGQEAWVSLEYTNIYQIQIDNEFIYIFDVATETWFTNVEGGTKIITLDKALSMIKK